MEPLVMDEIARLIVADMQFVPLQRLFDRHITDLDYWLKERGYRLQVLVDALNAAGYRRPHGGALTLEYVGSVVSVARQRAAKKGRAGSPSASARSIATKPNDAEAKTATSAPAASAAPAPVKKEISFLKNLAEEVKAVQAGKLPEKPERPPPGPSEAEIARAKKKSELLGEDIRPATYIRPGSKS